MYKLHEDSFMFELTTNFLLL